jgi:hypothetical protein
MMPGDQFKAARHYVLGLRFRLQPLPTFYQIVSTVSLSLLVALTICWILTGTEAIDEGFIVACEHAPFQPLAIVVAGLVYALSVSFLTCLLVLLIWPKWMEATAGIQRLVISLPRIAAALPLFALAAAWHRHRSPWLTILFSVMGLAALAWPHAYERRWAALIRPRFPSVRRSLPRAWARWCGLPLWVRRKGEVLFLLGCLAFLFLTPTHVAWTSRIGPVALVLLWGAALISVLSPAIYFSRMLRLRMLLPLAVVALVSSGFDLNDDHEVRLKHLERGSASAPEWNFFGWLKSRPDFKDYDEYPVFLISTEGGGLRAGYFASMVLATLQDENPAFAQHVYAISGVSGGSLGAAIFSSLVADHSICPTGKPCSLVAATPHEYQDRTRNVLSRDLLTPLLTAGLFPDLLQRILPFAVPVYDRARALEYGFEDAWRRAKPPNCEHCDGERFAADFRNLRGDPKTTLVPSLFLNTTGVEDGLVHTVTDVPIFYMDPSAEQNRFIYLDHRFDPLQPLPEFTYYFRDPVTIPLSTAVGLSARFPLVTPAGTITMNGRKRRYVDGGYFENSGTATLVELLSLLQSLRAEKTAMIDAGSSDSDRRASRFRTFVIIISANTCLDKPDRASAQDCEEGDLGAAEGHSMGETLSPLRTLLNTRSALAGISRRQLEWYIGALKRAAAHATGVEPAENAVLNTTLTPVDIAEFQLRRRDVRLPLSWLLAGTTAHDIEEQVEDAGDHKNATTRVNLQPSQPSNKKAFEAVMSTLKVSQIQNTGMSKRDSSK